MNVGTVTWRAGCGESRTPGSEGGGTAVRRPSYPTTLS